MSNVMSRLNKLEKATVPAETPRRVIRLIVEKDEGETPEVTIARWCAENPNEPRPSDEDFIILRSLVSPKRPE